MDGGEAPALERFSLRFRSRVLSSRYALAQRATRAARAARAAALLAAATAAFLILEAIVGVPSAASAVVRALSIGPLATYVVAWTLALLARRGADVAGGGEGGGGKADTSVPAAGGRAPGGSAALRAAASLRAALLALAAHSALSIAASVLGASAAPKSPAMLH
jgi:hypothetical protein